MSYHRRHGGGRKKGVRYDNDKIGETSRQARKRWQMLGDKEIPGRLPLPDVVAPRWEDYCLISITIQQPMRPAHRPKWPTLDAYEGAQARAIYQYTRCKEDHNE